MIFVRLYKLKNYSDDYISLLRLQRVEFFLDYETTDRQATGFDLKPTCVKTHAPFEIRQKFVSFQRVKILLFFKCLEKGAYNRIEPQKIILPVHIDR